jgi:hypothetical protein
MKNKNVIDRISSVIKNNNPGGGGQVRFIRMFMFSLCSIFILLLIYIVGVLIMMRGGFTGNTALDSDAYFKGCGILEKSCLDTHCNFYSRCDGGGHKDCRIYDCGNEYGIFIRELDNKIKTKREAKPDLKAIDDKRNACTGSMQVLEEKCLEGKTQATVKITTKGQCNIESFILSYENKGAKPAKSSAIGDGTYLVASDFCGKITKIVPVAEGGMSLDF